MNLGWKAFGLAVFSGILLSLAWFANAAYISFIAWIPLLILEQKYSVVKNIRWQKLRFILLTFFTFLIWNLLVTWWVANASIGGGVAAFLCNSLLMCITFVTYSNIKNRLQKNWAYFLLIPIWLAWEHIHTLWDITWTWLTLGNVFAFQHTWIQWYEYTGTSGGSAWILLVNLIIAKAILQNEFVVKKWKVLVTPVLMIVLPISVSFILLSNVHLKNTKDNYNVVIVQPNIDPYNEKFAMDYQSQFLKTLQLIKPKVNAETDYLVLPETFITDNINEEELDSCESVRWFRDSLIKQFPKLNIVVGCNTYLFYKNEKEITNTARKDGETGLYYDIYNAAIQISKTEVQVYHKSKLVPGVERMPFPALLKPLESLALDMGGTMGSLGTQAQRGVFKHPTRKAVIAPVVCYESVYADYLTEYMRMGANCIFIITNDGWWEDTPGYIQHLNFARLRAIENRVCIARCANTGVSCFIYPDGSIEQATAWWQPTVISGKTFSDSSPTFFNRFGDLLSYASIVIALLSLLMGFYLRFAKK
jgi:apolipoprotein N-acyltransferase